MSARARRKSGANIAKMRRRKGLYSVLLIMWLLIIAGALFLCVRWFMDRRSVSSVLPYNLEREIPLTSMGMGTARAVSFAGNYCVGENNVSMDGIALEEGQCGALFNLDAGTVMYGQNIYDKIYPASMTKIMTALLALEYGNLDATVTISESAVTLEEGSQVCGFAAGDRVPFGELINCLLVYSGNDAAAAIAETVAGSQDAFVQMMNTRAQELGMTGTHFTNPHGLQDEEHYTTVYDIYLMLNETMKNSTFLQTIQLGSYTLEWEDTYGNVKAGTYDATDHYLTGEATAPKGVTILGGKTGTTSLAGNCLALITQNAYGRPYISVITNASTKELLYVQMNQLLEKINS